MAFEWEQLRRLATYLRVSVENIDELLLLDGRDHDGATLGIDGQVLARHDSTTSGLAEGLHVHALEQVLGRIVLEDVDPAGVGTDDDVVLVASGQTEGHERTDDAEHFDREEGVDFAGVRIRTHQLQGLAPGHDDLLQLGPGKISVYRVRYPGGPLKGEVVQMHIAVAF